jgi:hypothetical protein
LAPFGVDARLSDLYRKMYPAADGYVTRDPLDASNVEHLMHAFALAGAGCTAIITNTPHNTREACAILKNLISLMEGQHVSIVAKPIWRAVARGCATEQRTAIA